MKLRQLGPNRTEVRLPSGAVIFFSYETPVAAQLPQGGFVRTKTKYSVTTSKHINQWLDGRRAEEVDQSVLEELSLKGAN